MILILGELDDPHIRAVSAHLREQGAAYRVLDPLAALSLPSISVPLEPTQTFAAIWDRLKPVAVPRSEKGQYVFRERLAFVRSLQLLNGSARLMNPPLSTERARNKALQLSVAAEAGLMTPRTYVGNDADEVRRFAKSCAEGVIAKSGTWYFSLKNEFAFTKLIAPEMLASEPSITYSPLIYQEYVPKAYELRVTCVGKRMFGVKIRSQENSKTIVDWRVDQFGLKYERANLSSLLRVKLQRVQIDLGLVFGAFDLIKTPTGEDVFLEVNSTGNWLWLEKRAAVPIAKEIAMWLAGRCALANHRPA